MITRTLLGVFLTITTATSFAQQFGSFKDARDGKVYKTVKIGSQIWMAENLNVSTFRNGDLIPEAKTKEEWVAAGKNKKPAWCYYDNHEKYGIKYGKLYNYYAVKDPRGLAPLGYHIASDEDWDNLDSFLFLEKSIKGVGEKMKSITGWGKYHEGGGSMTCPNCIYWNSEYRRKVACHLCRDTRLISKRPELNSGNGTNSSGFTGLPSGIRIYGHFDYIGTRAFWWISSGMTTGLSQKDPALMTFYSFPEFFEKANGCSVRCIKD